MKSRITCTFRTHEQAEAALAELRGLGIADGHLSVIARHDNHATMMDHAAHDEVGDAAGTGAVTGAGVGLLFGLAALLVPGVGPFLAAGALGSIVAATTGTLVTGAAVGAATGALSASLVKIGYNEQDANFYGEEVEQGHVFVAVESDDQAAVTREQIVAVIARHGGRFNVATANRI